MDGALLAHLLRTGGQVDIDRALWRDHRAVLHADPAIRGIRVVAQGHRAGGLIGRDQTALATRPGHDAHAGVGLDALGDRHALIEERGVVDRGIGAVRHELAPAGGIGELRIARQRHAEVPRVQVRADEPGPVEPIGVVAHAGGPRQHHARGFRRVGQRHRAQLVRVVALHLDPQQRAASRGIDRGEERLVRFLVDDRIGRRVRAEHMTADRAALQQHGILPHVEDAAAVGGPDHGFQRAGNAVGQILAGGQVTEPELMAATTHGVLGPGDERAVVADFHIAHAEVVVPSRKLVAVEHRLTRAAVARAHPSLLLVARRKGGPRPPAMIELARRRVVLGDASAELAGQPRLQRRQSREHALGVRLLGPQVPHHLVALALRMVVAQPVVLIAALTMRARDDGHALDRDRRTSLVALATCLNSHDEPEQNHRVAREGHAERLQRASAGTSAVGNPESDPRPGREFRVGFCIPGYPGGGS